ncbi:MFS transporter [Corynebacterium glyciniphilum]|uniref:MFS transporter n=1 Tax=Corynebacterium glyciniphilum TaxID=1404244 RepID=UPI003DA1453D
MSTHSPHHSARLRGNQQHPARGGTVALLVVTALLVLMQLYSAIPLVAPMGTDLGADVSFALSTVFSICYAVGFLVWGPLADQYGRRRIMVIGLLTLTVVTFACGFASSAPLLAVLRGLQGLTASSFAPVALAYLAEATPPARRATAIGAMSTAFLVAGILGQVAASAVALELGWEWMFILSGVMLALCLVGVVLVVAEPPRHTDGVRLTRRFAAVATVATRPSVLLLSAAHLTLLLSFVAMYTGLGPHLSSLGLNSSQVIWLRLVGLPGMFASLIAGRITRRLGTAGVARAGFALAAAGLLLEAALSGTLVGTGASSLVFVTGVALAVPSMITLFGESAAPNRAGGMALNGFVLFLGASLGPLTAHLGLSFPVLLLGLAILMAIAVASLTGFTRLTRSTMGTVA